MNIKDIIYPLVIAGSFITSIPSSAIEIFKDDKNAIALRGYISGIYHNGKDSDEFNEGSSRWGFDIKRELNDGWTAGITTEWGVNFDKNTNLTIGGSSQAPAGSSDDAMFTRLGYVHLAHKEWGTIGIGKQWAVFYDVTAGTDILNYWGASVSGSFNLSGDGGVSGTGRAEQSITWRKNYNNLNIGIQLQAQDEVVLIDLPEEHSFSKYNGDHIATVGNGFGVSAMYTLNKLILGIGYNASDIEIEPAFGGSSANDLITAVSVTYGVNGQAGLYSSLLFTASENHEVDDLGGYIDAESSEFILKYTLVNGLSIYGGFNHLEPVDSGYVGKYQFHYNFAGAEYLLFNNAAKVFFETKLEDTTSTSGNNNDDTQFAVGLTVYL